MPEPNELREIRRCLREYSQSAGTAQLKNALGHFDILSSNILSDRNPHVSCAKNLINSYFERDIENINSYIRNSDEDPIIDNELRNYLDILESYGSLGFGGEQASMLQERIGKLLRPQVISYKDASEVNNYEPQQYQGYEKDVPLVPPVNNYLMDHNVVIEKVMNGLLKIISVEGPVQCRRAYRIYARGCLIFNIDRGHSLIFNQAIRTAILKGIIKEDYGHVLFSQEDKFVWLADSKSVIVRTRGGRDLQEIPPTEIGALMTYLGVKNKIVSKDDLLREVFNFYHYRHTETMRRRLLQIMNRYVMTAG